MKKASIIIAVDSEYSLINNFFEFFFKSHDYLEYEIIVVDDHCINIETISYLKQLKDEKKIDVLIRLSQKEGFGRANNIAIKHSSTDKLVLINTDIILCDNEITKLLDRMDETDCDAIQPLLIYPQNGRIQSCGHIFGHLFNRHAFENNKPDIFKDIKNIERLAITPAFCIIKKKSFIEAGMFDIFYYNSFEALDLSLSLTLTGGKCFVATDIISYHIRMASRSNIDYNEEQQSPYFWEKYSSKVKNDYIEIIDSQFTNDIKSKKYICCCFTHLDLVSELKKTGIQIEESINLQHKGKIDLFGLLPFSLMQTLYPLVFLCNNIGLMFGNELWKELRSNPNDLVIDSAGNVIHLCDM